MAEIGMGGFYDRIDRIDRMEGHVHAKRKISGGLGSKNCRSFRRERHTPIFAFQEKAQGERRSEMKESASLQYLLCLPMLLPQSMIWKFTAQSKPSMIVSMMRALQRFVERPIFGLARRKLIQKYRALRALNDRL